MLALLGTVFVTSYVNVFCRAFQQMNVMSKKYAWVVPTSFAMAACEVFVIFNVAHNDWRLVIPALGLGAGLGCLSSMKLHTYLSNRKTLIA